MRKILENTTFLRGFEFILGQIVQGKNILKFDEFLGVLMAINIPDPLYTRWAVFTKVIISASNYVPTGPTTSP